MKTKPVGAYADLLERAGQQCKSISELARKIEMHPSSLWGAWQGKRPIPLRNLILLAKMVNEQDILALLLKQKH